MSAATDRGTPGEVFLAFLRLGLTSFGGPVAHFGYFRAELVARRRWLDEPAFADVVALCQFLPGPASSQTGFALGLMRAGWRGGFAAWAGFTLPSAALMMLFAVGAADLARSVAGAGLLHGLKLVAVAVVAQAVWSMARTLCLDAPRIALAFLCAALVLVAPATAGQIAAIGLGAVAGVWLRRTGDAAPTRPSRCPVTRRAAVACLAVCATLLVLLPLARQASGRVAAFEAFYRSGALVFGGGHVVLPLLRDAVVSTGWVPESVFLTGYGAAQAVPGPLFTVAAYLGAAGSAPLGGIAGGSLALVAIFLPGLLLVAGALPFWVALQARSGARAALRGVNAAVVGVLGAALYDPLWRSTVVGSGDGVAVLAGIALLVSGRLPPLGVVALGAAYGLAGGLLA